MKPLRHQVAEIARQLHAAGWVANHDGNVTARDGNRYIATPTATSKRAIGDRDCIAVDAAGKVIGNGRVFGEIGLHLAVYARRPDVHAVIHAHPPCATAIASSRSNPIEVPFIAEAVVSLGATIPKIPFAAPGEPAKAALAPWCELVDAALLGNHGVIAWGADLEQAYLRLEVVEHLAKIALAAAPLGGVEPLPAGAIAALLAARAKAGLGRAADRAAASAATAPAVVACAPAPHANVATMSPDGTRDDPARARFAGHDLARVIREELVAALKR